MQISKEEDILKKRKRGYPGGETEAASNLRL